MKNLIFMLMIAAVLPACVLKSDYDALKEENDKLRNKMDSGATAFGLMPPTEEQVEFRQLAIDSLKKLPDVSRGQGFRIPKAVAERHINDFKGIQGNLKSCLDAVDLVISSSYSFGLDEVKKLLDDIEALNKNYPNRFSGDNELTGIRFHLGKNLIEVTNDDGTSKTVFYVDAFITPVNKVGVHFFTDSGIIHTDIPDPNNGGIVILDTSNSGSLNNSNPCPDVCP